MKSLCARMLCAFVCFCLLSACAPAQAPAPVQTAPAATPEPAPTPEPTPEPPPEPRYMRPEELYSRLRAGEAPLLLDLQPAVYYDESGHLEGAVRTEAYPANTDALLSLLDAQRAAVEAAPFTVLIDMAGKAGAHNAFHHYAAAGVDAEKLYILEGGMLAWPYTQYRETAPGAYTPQYMTAREVRSALRDEAPILLLDLRGFDAYNALHVEGSLNVPVFMPGADENIIRGALFASLDLIAASGAPRIVLITEHAGEEAAMAYDYYLRHGVDIARLYILDSGIGAWPEQYGHYLETTEAEDLSQEAGPLTEDLSQEAGPAADPALPPPEDEAVLVPF